MDLTLTRKRYANWGIISELSDSNGEVLFTTLEHAYCDSTGTIYRPKLTLGIHDCILGTHQLDTGGPIQAYEITEVLGHSGILFHIGNYNKDSDGCVLLGTALGQQCITGSKVAFDKFMAMQSGQNFKLTVIS
jgi:Family of unknown function (DUF5675)